MKLRSLPWLPPVSPLPFARGGQRRHTEALS
jgi:hypothetical protein